jgi:hypothetical protein
MGYIQTHGGATPRNKGRRWLISYDKYASNSKEQLEFEYDVIALTALAYTPLFLVEHEAFSFDLEKGS